MPSTVPRVLAWIKVSYSGAMRFRLFAHQTTVAALELEQPSTALRVHLTRQLRRKLEATETEDAGAVVVARMNRLINRSRTILELPIYVLEADDWGDFMTAEYAWHYGEFELIFRRMDTIQFAEFLGELIQDRHFAIGTVNKLLQRDGLAFKFVDHGGLHVEVLPLSEVEELAKIESQWHENIRLLLARMEAGHCARDFAAVIHAGASVFETLAKEIVGLPTVQSQTLKSFFDRYRKDSGLPTAVLDHVLALYDRRNVTPLAGHGSLTPPPQLSEGESRTLIEMTKAFVAIEYKLKLAGASITSYAAAGAAASGAGAAGALSATPAAVGGAAAPTVGHAAGGAAPAPAPAAAPTPPPTAASAGSSASS
jgi:hypothetical protein